MTGNVSIMIPIKNTNKGETMQLNQIIRADILAMTAYKVTEVPADCIKLDAMESPYEYSDELKAELAKELANAPLRLYPTPYARGLPDAIRALHKIDAGADILLGTGSDELIRLLTMLTGQAGSTMLALEPSFVMYRVNAEFFGMKYVGVPLNEDFTLNVDAVLAAIAEHQPQLIFIAYPNNPTGVPFSVEDVNRIIAAAPGLVVIDEAYGAFSSHTFLSQAGTMENVVVLRTLSKIGFAGIRVGYAVGHPNVMHELRKITPPYNMNQLSLTAAKFALQYHQFIDEHINKQKSERERMRTMLKAWSQIQVFPSEGNFITMRVPDAQALYQALLDHNILIKNLHGVHPLLNQCARITVGKPEQNQQVLGVMQQLYGTQA